MSGAKLMIHLLQNLSFLSLWNMTHMIWAIFRAQNQAVLVSCDSRVWYSHVTVNVILITANVITNNWHFNQSINYITFRFKWYNSRLSLMDRPLWWCNQYHNQSTFTWQGFQVSFHDIKLRSKLSTYCMLHTVCDIQYVTYCMSMLHWQLFWVLETFSKLFDDVMSGQNDIIPQKFPLLLDFGLIHPKKQ